MFMSRQSSFRLIFFPVLTNWINKLTLKENTIAYCFTLFICDPSTFLASSSVLGPYFPLRTGCLFTYMELYHYLICIFKFSVWISSRKLYSALRKQHVQLVITSHQFGRMDMGCVVVRPWASELHSLNTNEASCRLLFFLKWNRFFFS